MASFAGGAGADTLTGTAERDYFAAGGGNDTIDSGAGDDWIEGGTGADTFVFGPGCGWDCIGDFNMAEGDRIDLRGWSGIRSMADLTIQTEGGDTVILFGSSDGVRLMGVSASSLTTAHFLFTGATDGGTGGSGDAGGPEENDDDAPGGGTAGRVLTGTSARDELYGSADADTIIGGGGYDYLEGGAGSDTFVCAPGDSWDYIQDFQAGSGGDVLDLSAWSGIRSLTDLTITSDASGTSLVFGPNDGMRLNGVPAGALTAGNFRFAGQGTGGPTSPPPPPPPTTGGGQTLTGTAGRDNLVGGAGNDTITAGAGADYLEGRGGSDTFVARTGDGWDYVQDFQAGAAGDVIDLTGAAGIHGMGDLTFTSDATGTSVVYGTSDGLRLNGVAAGALTATNFRFAGQAGGAGLRIEEVGWTPRSADPTALTQVNAHANGTALDIGSDAGLGAVSGDGRYAVFSASTTHGSSVFLKDLETGALRTLAWAEKFPNQNSGYFYSDVTISADGRYAGFIRTTASSGYGSYATDTVQIMDLQTGNVVSSLSAGNEISELRLSANGDHVSFKSATVGRGYGTPSILHYVGPNGSKTNGVPGSWNSILSSDGQRIVYSATVDGTSGLYLWDVPSDTKTRLAIDPAIGAKPLAFSADGQSLLFTSGDDGLVSGDGNGAADLFLHDLDSGTTTRVSTTSTGGEANGASTSGTLTADGRTLVFVSSASNLVDGDTNGLADIFAMDLQTGAVRRISTAADGEQFNGASTALSASADGGRVVYTTVPTNLDPDVAAVRRDIVAVDTVTLAANGRYGAAGNVSLTFRFAAGAATAGTATIDATIDWGDGRTSVQTAPAGATALSAEHQYAAGGQYAGSVTLSDQQGGTATAAFAVQSAPNPEALRRASVGADGSEFPFYSYSRNPLLGGDGHAIAFTNGTMTMVKDFQTGAVVTAPGSSGAAERSISSDMRTLVYSRWDQRPTPSAPSGANVLEVYALNVGTDAPIHVSTASDGTLGNGESEAGAISGNGRYVAFSSFASNFAANDGNGQKDVFVKDLQTGALVCASTTADGQVTPGASLQPRISADGRVVLFQYIGPDHVGDGLYVKDLQTGTRSLVASGVPEYRHALSANGRYAAYLAPAGAGGGAGGGGTGQPMVAYVHDLQTGTVAVASAAADGTPGDGAASEIVISDDGRYVAFSSTATNLVSDMPDAGAHIFHKDMQTGAVTLVRMPDGPAPAPIPFGFRTHNLSISGDGRYVGFASESEALVPGDTNANGDVFLFDTRATGSTLTGGAGHDVLLGNALGDTLAGGDGEDYLAGGDGDDVLDGNEGADLLAGGTGADTLTGGVGADVFSFGQRSGMDVITDFNPLGDRIQLAAGQDWTVGMTTSGDALIWFTSTDGVTLTGVRPDQVTSGLFITG